MEFEKNIKLFGKYQFNDIEIRDPSLKRYLSLKPTSLPHTFARHANKQFAKSQVNIVERVVNKLMRGGTGEKLGTRIIRTHGKMQGKKTKAIKIVEEAFDVVSKKTSQNPIQLLVRAIENSAQREEITRVKFGGTSYQVAVDSSAVRRLDQSLRNLTLAAIMSSFKNKLTVADALANEIELAAKNDPNSYSIKRKNDIERMSKSAR